MSELIAGAVVGESWPGSTGLLDAPAEPLELELAEVPEPTLADLVQWHRSHRAKLAKLAEKIAMLEMEFRELKDRYDDLTEDISERVFAGAPDDEVERVFVVEGRAHLIRRTKVAGGWSYEKQEKPTVVLC